MLSNLFLHYAFDRWMTQHYPTVPWCRYADDGLVHCKTEQEAQLILDALKRRYAECKLEIHPDKTKIVYCKDDNRREKYAHTEFTFLGYDFRRRETRNKQGKLFLSFSPAVSKAAMKSMRAKTRQKGYSHKTKLSLNDIANEYNLVLRGWINYYGHYNRSALYPVMRHFNRTLVKWALRKFKKLRSKTRASTFLREVMKREPSLFAHWEAGIVGGFA